MSALTLITCTGGRPDALDLCIKWMNHQTFKGRVRWIVVDDCKPETAYFVPRSRKHQDDWRFQVYIMDAQPDWKPGDLTLSRNLLAALKAPACMIEDKIVFIEDDDHYSPDYLEWMDSMLDKAELVGEISSRYYNVVTREYRDMRNFQHASLSQTGMRASMIPQFQKACEADSRFIDIRLWHGATSRNSLLIPGNRVTGIKGMPGRAGIGIGHRPNATRSSQWTRDRDLSVLRSWIGEDATLYERFGEAVAA